MKIQLKKKKVLLISTYKISCGIASFCETLESLIKDDFEVEVFPLDQFFLRSEMPHLKKQGDLIIKEIINKAKNFDVVNLQWEPSFFGKNEIIISQRLEKLLSNIPNLTLTVHTVFEPKLFSLSYLLNFYVKNNPIKATKLVFKTILEYFYKSKISNIFKRYANKKNIRFIVHTKREFKEFKLVHQFKNVYHHPLSCIRKGWEEKINNQTPAFRSELESLYGKDTIFIGFFGFLTSHKGIETVIDSLRLLPNNYKLLIFGGIHPNSINMNEAISPYLKNILGLLDGSRKFNKNKPEKDIKYMGSLADRVIFKGSPDDFEFALAINTCDVNVFPYQEVGQSASAPVATSVELKKKTIVSNNKTFAELKKYFPESLDFVDIGNSVQISQTIQSLMVKNDEFEINYNNLTMKKFYSDIFNNIKNDEFEISYHNLAVKNYYEDISNKIKNGAAVD